MDDSMFFFLMIRRPPRSTLFPYTDALPIYPTPRGLSQLVRAGPAEVAAARALARVEVLRAAGLNGPRHAAAQALDRKSTRLNSSHANISYAVFCLKKKTILPSFSLLFLLPL